MAGLRVGVEGGQPGWDAKNLKKAFDGVGRLY
jgi:hypothetical protein